MKQGKYVEELITNLTVALSHARTLATNHTLVEQSCRSVITTLRAACRADEGKPIAIRVVKGQIVQSGCVLISSTISGRRLIELVRSCSSGGLILGAETSQRELQRFLEFAKELPLGIHSLEEARASLEKAGVTNIRLVHTEEEFQWFGAAKATSTTWSDAGLDLEEALPVYQSMYETVEVSMRQAATGDMVDMNEARTVSEVIRHAAEEGFDDLFQLAGTPNYDAYTVGHSTRVALLAVYVGTYLDAPTEVLTELGAAGLMHDVGKGRIPHEILYKPARLDDEEWKVMSTHPHLGVEILLESEDVGACALGAAWGHHLRFDGKGYPETRPWAQSSRMTSLIQVCDVFEALTALRPYKPALSPTRALEIMMSDPGAFNPAALSAFSRAMGLYPPGRFVRLSDESVARVHRGGASLDRPIVRILPSGNVLDLGDQSAAHLTIVGTLTELAVQEELESGATVVEEESEEVCVQEQGPDEPSTGADFTGCPLC